MLTFDPTNIRYEDETEKNRYAEKNQQACEALNKGARFSMVFPSPIYDDRQGGPGVLEFAVALNYAETDLHYLLVTIEGIGVMPYPVFEVASGATFLKSAREEWRQLVNDGGEPDDLYSNLHSFHLWLEARFDGYVGYVISRTGEKQERQAAIQKGLKMADGTYTGKIRLFISEQFPSHFSWVPRIPQESEGWFEFPEARQSPTQQRDFVEDLARCASQGAFFAVFTYSEVVFSWFLYMVARKTAELPKPGMLHTQLEIFRVSMQEGKCVITPIPFAESGYLEDWSSVGDMFGTMLGSAYIAGARFGFSDPLAGRS